jgi:hemerythrin superfamily protein
MATNKSSSSTKSSNGNGAKTKPSTKPDDAISLLKADHRTVEKLFEDYESSRDNQEKAELAQQICQELTIHTMIEEEIFYPACQQAEIEEEMLDEAQVEHDGAKTLINEIEAGSPDEEYYDAKVHVLSEMIKHHVNEEEKRGGLFTKARQTDMDLDEIGARIAARKEELMGEAEAGGLPKAEAKSMLHMAAE